MTQVNTVALWDIAEFELTGPVLNHPFAEADLSVTFSQGNRDVRVTGFYDGDDAGRPTWRFRFMPDRQGEWRYRTSSDVPELNAREGALTCGPPSPDAHGPVRVRNTFHFAHADGTPYYPFGTTCYAWTHQPEVMQEETLATLATSGFNKVRMGVFPKHYIYNENEPLHPIFERRPDGSEDFTRPNVVAFRHFERQVERLMRLGIEADVIVFHPYDRWHYCDMSFEQDCAYVKYLTARLSAYRNVWWSLANEFDFLIDVKPVPQWDRYFHIIEEHDSNRHLTSIHNGEPEVMFDHRKPWISHVCVQNTEVKKTPEWRRQWGKPLVNDELEYEGDIPRPWGNISARELVHRFWITVLGGGYAGHGETFMHPEDLLWWAKGGSLRGESAPRIKFLRQLVEEDGRHGLTPLIDDGRWEFRRVSGARDGDVTFLYFGEHQPREWAVGLPKQDGDYVIDLIDTWTMSITPIEKAPLPVSPALRQRGGAITGDVPEAAFGIRLPAKPHMAVRIKPR